MKNWRTRIDQARERGEFTTAEQILSGQWLDCACGEQDERIKRHKKGQPLDNELSSLGKRFSYEVCDNHFRNAERVLKQIETRAAQLIAEIENQPKGTRTMSNRYFVDERSGCMAVRDHEITDPEYNGLHEDTEGVIKFWGWKTKKGEACTTCGHVPEFNGWDAIKEDIKAAHELCDSLNQNMHKAEARAAELIAQSDKSKEDDQ